MPHHPPAEWELGGDGGYGTGPAGRKGPVTLQDGDGTRVSQVGNVVKVNTDPPDLTRYLHWGTNDDTSNEGLTLNGHGTFAFDTDGGDFATTTGSGDLSHNTEGGAYSAATAGGSYSVTTGGGTIDIDSTRVGTDGTITIRSGDHPIELLATGTGGSVSVEANQELVLLSPDIQITGSGTSADLITLSFSATHSVVLDENAKTVVTTLPTGGSNTVKNHSFATILTTNEATGVTTGTFAGTATFDGGSP